MLNLKFLASTVAEIRRESQNSKSRGRGYNKKCVLNRGLELMKLIFAVSDVSLTIGFTRCYKAEGFYLSNASAALDRYIIKSVCVT